MQRRLRDEYPAVRPERGGDLGKKRGRLLELVDHVEGEHEIDLAGEVGDAEAVGPSEPDVE